MKDARKTERSIEIALHPDNTIRLAMAKLLGCDSTDEDVEAHECKKDTE